MFTKQGGCAIAIPIYTDENLASGYGNGSVQPCGHDLSGTVDKPDVSVFHIEGLHDLTGIFGGHTVGCNNL